MIKLIVGLGNPGIEYELTRHNVAWLVLDCFDKISGNIWKDKFKGQYTNFSFSGDKIYVLKPMTYMILSGESVQKLCQFFKIQRNEILVIQDELDLPFGQIHFKEGGGLAGHNGLKSITQMMGGQDFYRLRVGIGRPDRGSVSSWVLSKFPQELDGDLEKITKQTNEAIELFLKSGFKIASNKYNKKNLIQ